MFRQYTKINSTGSDLDRNASVEQVYRPIIRGYFAVAAIYYFVMTLVNIWSLSGADLLIMAGTSGGSAVVIGAAWFALRVPLSIGRLEIITCVVNLLVITNVMVALHLDYAQAKLVYFMMMVMIFALACISTRQAFASIAAALTGLFYQLSENDMEMMSIYGFIAFAAAMSSITITALLRRAIGVIVAAKREAEGRLAKAQNVSETMRLQSRSDSLTDLPNRRAFFDTLKECMDNRDPGKNGWLILLDLDGFKAVNDIYGHLMGDKLLQIVATRMRDFCGSAAKVHRMGGDEFNIILTGKFNEQQVETWCQDLLEKIAEVYQIDDRLIRISGSIGCHKIAADKSEVLIIRSADYALLHAKKNGKNRVVVFHKKHELDAANRYKIEQALRAADFDTELELLFQPQFDLGVNEFTRAEALVRWYSPELGQIEPDHFIKIAEECGLIANITLAVIRKATGALNSWDFPFPLSINLSGHDLLSDHIIDQIIKHVKESGLDASLIEFEVTETAMMADTKKASANMLRLAELGHPLALDDFGTGYSNFTYLRTLPINKLKVDRSFMENITDPMTEKILHSLSGIARTLGVHCLLEGIESELELIMAKRVGAQSIQGYFFGKPMNATGLHRCIEEQAADKATRVRMVGE